MFRRTFTGPGPTSSGPAPREWWGPKRCIAGTNRTRRPLALLCVALDDRLHAQQHEANGKTLCTGAYSGTSTAS